jgi:hypothetical protein
MLIYTLSLKLFLSVNWNASGGGAFAVLPLSQVGNVYIYIELIQ